MNIPNQTEFNKNNIREKFIKNQYKEFYEFLCNKYPQISFQEKLYWYFNCVTEIPKCPMCGKNVKFVSFKLGYQTYCSNKCANNSQVTKQKIRKSTEEHFGSMDNFVEYMKEKTKQTCLERYGVENPFAAEEIKEKIKQTCLARYGVENYVKTDECKKRTKQTCLERYGVESYTKTDECKKRTKLTKKERYGDEKYVNIEKIKQTCLARYGVDNYGKTDEWKEKTIKTCLARYGVDNYGKTSEYIEKTKQTCITKYNNQTYLGSNDCKEKTIKTCLARYGVQYPSQLECIKKKIKETKDKNHTHNTSSVEEQFASWLKDNNINFVRQYKSEQYPFCCDFYFPDIDLYFEINGFWTHGLHPFDANNKDDVKKLESWKQMNTKFYNNAINTWTVSDPLKVKTAKENKLNFKVVYSDRLNDVIKEYKNVTY